jgi:uncharacterized membrane protein (DUF106 family)
MTDIIASWFDVLTAMLTLVSVLGECYAIALVLKITPKAMHTFRYFLCACTVSFCIRKRIIFFGY